MSQEILLRKFKVFLQLQLRDTHRALEEKKSTTDLVPWGRVGQFQIELSKYIDTIIKHILEGLCWGFAIIHGVKDRFGNLERWEKCLVDMATWDETYLSLNRIIYFPAPIFLFKTLEQIFYETIDALLFHQAHEAIECLNLGITQQNFLCPNKHIVSVPASVKDPIAKPALNIIRSYIEVTDTDGKLHTIKDRKTLSGRFSKINLTTILEQSDLSDALIIIRNDSHAIRLRKNPNEDPDKQTWLIYDSGYDHTKLGSIHKILPTKECVDEIAARVGLCIGIEVASFFREIQPFLFYKKLLNEIPASLISGLGLFLMAIQSKEQLFEFLKNAFDSNDSRVFFEVRINLSLRGHFILNCTTFYILLKYAPESLNIIFRYAERSKELLHALARALFEKACIYSGFYHLINIAPQLLIPLLQLAEKSNDNYFGKTVGILFQQSKHYPKNIFDLICSKCPNSLPFLFQLASKFKTDKILLNYFLEFLESSATSIVDRISAPQLFDLFSTVFLNTLDNGTPGIYLFISFVWNEFVNITHALLMIPEGMDLLLRALSLKNSNNKTSWQMLDDRIQEKQCILEMLKINLTKKCSEELVILGARIRNAAYFKNTDYRGLCKRSSFFGNTYVKTEIWQVLMNQIRQILESRQYQSPNNRALKLIRKESIPRIR